MEEELETTTIEKLTIQKTPGNNVNVSNLSATPEPQNEQELEKWAQDEKEFDFDTSMLYNMRWFLFFLKDFYIFCKD